MNNYLSEAFKKLDILDEDVFELDKDGLTALKDFEDSDEDDMITVVDPDAESEEDLEDSYIGKVILDCSVCHTDIYKDKEDITIDEESGLANIGEECPYCYSSDGFKVIGEVKPFVEVEVDTDDDVDVEVDGEEVEKNESLRRNRRLKESKKLNESPDGWEFIKYDGVGPVESDAYYKYVGNDIQLVIYPPQTVAGNTYDTWEAEIYTDNGSSYQSIDDTRDGFDSFEEAEAWINSKIKNLGESLRRNRRLKESCSINQCQKWVDYDMKKYKKISDDTMKKIKSSGYSVVKDQYGDYEVIADRKDTSKNEACDGKRKSRKRVAESKMLSKTRILKESMSDSELAREIEKAVEWLKESQEGCSTIKLDGRLAVCVGWLSGYSESTSDGYVHAEDDPSWCVNAGIKVWTSDSMRTDYEYINAPYDEDTGDVWDTDVTISENENYSKLAKYFMKEYEAMSEYDIDKDGAIVGKWSDEDEEFEESCGNRKSRKMKESIEDIKIDTGDQEITVSAKDKEEIESDDEMIAPLSDEVKTDIETGSDDTVDVDVDEFSEEDFDELGESYLKKVYENVDGYKTTSAKTKGNKLYVEGLIKFNSGKQKKTSFVFESRTITKTGKAKLIGENLQISRGHKSFKLTGTINNGKFISESLNYNYRVKNGSSSQRVYGTAKKSK